MADSLFSGMNLKAGDASEDSSSGFSFINSTTAEHQEEPTTVSGFSFISSGAGGHDHEVGDQDTPTISSAFSFISETNAETGGRDHVPDTTVGLSAISEGATPNHDVPSSFSFIHAPTDSPSNSYLDSLAGMKTDSAPLEIKLNATAQPNKKIKKKASSKKVGYAREEHEVSDAQPTTPAWPVHSVKPEAQTAIPERPSASSVEINSGAVRHTSNPPAYTSTIRVPDTPTSSDVDSPAVGAAPIGAAITLVTEVVEGNDDDSVKSYVSQESTVSDKSASNIKTGTYPPPQIVKRSNSRDGDSQGSKSSGSKRTFFSSIFGSSTRKPDTETSDSPHHEEVHTPTSSQMMNGDRKNVPKPSTSSDVDDLHQKSRDATTYSPDISTRHVTPQDQHSSRPVETKNTTPTLVQSTTPPPSASKGTSEIPSPKSLGIRASKPSPVPSPSPTLPTPKPEQKGEEPNSVPSPEPVAVQEVDPLQQMEEKMAALMFDFHEHTSRLCTEMQGIQKRHKELLAQRESLENEQSKFQKQLLEKEREQQQLAESEEFEQADALTSIIERLKLDTHARADALRAIGVDIETLEKKGSETRGKQLQVIEDMSRQLRDLNTEQSRLLVTTVREANKKFSQTDRAIKSDEERISLAKDLNDRDTKAVKEESDQIEAAIASRTSGASERKLELQDKICAQDEEIAALEKLLKEKREHRAALTAELQDALASISSVRKHFASHLARLEERSQMCERGRKEIEVESASLSASKSDYMQQKERFDAREASLRSRFEALNAELDIVQKIKGILDLSASGSVAHPIEVSASVRTLQEAVAEAEECVHVLLKQKGALENRLLILADELRAVTEQLPIAEQAKKAAAAARNFKEAGVQNNEIKHLTSQRDEVQAEIARIQEHATQLDKDVDAARDVQASHVARLLEAQRDVDLTIYRGLMERIHIIKDAKESLQNTSGSRIKLSAAVLLDAELAILSSSATELRNKHSGVEGCGLDAFDDIDRECAKEQVETSPETQDEHTEEPVSEAVPIQEGVESTQDEDIEEPSSEIVAEEPVQIMLSPQEKMMEAQYLYVQIQMLTSEIDKAVANDDFDTAAQLDEQMVDLTSRLELLGVSMEDVQQHIADADADADTNTHAGKEAQPAAEDAEQKESVAEVPETEPISQQAADELNPRPEPEPQP